MFPTLKDDATSDQNVIYSILYLNRSVVDELRSLARLRSSPCRCTSAAARSSPTWTRCTASLRWSHSSRWCFTSRAARSSPTSMAMFVLTSNCCSKTSSCFSNSEHQFFLLMCEVRKTFEHQTSTNVLLTFNVFHLTASLLFFRLCWVIFCRSFESCNIFRNDSNEHNFSNLRQSMTHEISRTSRKYHTNAKNESL